MFQINVVRCCWIPLVVFKDGPIHFSMSVNYVDIPVRIKIAMTLST